MAVSVTVLKINGEYFPDGCEKEISCGGVLLLKQNVSLEIPPGSPITCDEDLPEPVVTEILQMPNGDKWWIEQESPSFFVRCQPVVDDNEGVSQAEMTAAISAATTGLAPLDSPLFLNNPRVPTASVSTSTTQAASTAFVQAVISAAITALVNGAPGALDALNELAAAMGNDPNFAATVAGQIAAKLSANNFTSVAEVNAGSDNAKFITSLALEGSKYQDQDNSKLFITTAGSANTYTATLVPAIAAYTNGMIIYLKFHVANTGASTVNVNGLGAVSIVKEVATAVASGDIPINTYAALIYNGTAFQFIAIPARFGILTGYTSGAGTISATDTVLSAINKLNGNDALKTDKLLSQNNQTGTTYTLALADADKLVTMNNASANTLTIPLNSVVAFGIGTQILLGQLGAGQTTVAATGGVTLLLSASRNKLANQNATATLIKTATDTWILSGDTSA